MIDKNKVTADEQLQRMKVLMSYGINESKQPVYSSVEYNKVAADGKLYGIVREGTKYFIKVAKNAKGGLISENFDYIGGFRNRKNNEFDSFASAQRYFGEKMMDINESVDNVQKRVIAEAWNLEGKKDMIEEQTKKVQSEIARQRQIMENAVRIAEGKKQVCDMPDCPKAEEQKAEDIKKNPSAPFVTVPADGVNANEKGNLKGGKKKPVKESTETPLTSRENPDFMDKTHGTKIGKNAPFDDRTEDTEDAVADDEGGEAVNEGASMHDADCQNTPSVGVGEKGDTDPFDEKASVNESLDDLDDSLDDDADFDDEDDSLDGFDEETPEVDVDVEEEPADGVEEPEVDVDVTGCDDIAARMDSLEAKLDSILDAINNMKYDDEEPLYSDDEESADDVDAEDDFDDEDEDDFDDEDTEVVESVSYKRMKARRMNEENRLDDFGKHPAYQKKVMTLPSNDNFKKDGQYDMNDSSVDGEAPYGQSKGDQAPFKNRIDAIEDAITESVLKILKKKLG